MLVEITQLVDDDEDTQMIPNVTSITQAEDGKALILGIGPQPGNNIIELPIDEAEGRAVAVKIVIA